MKRSDKKKPMKKETVVAFKVDAGLAALLDSLPNKSAFIRKAIAAQLGVGCPLCQGKGIVPRGVNEHYGPVIEKHNCGTCVKCGNSLRVPLKEDELLVDDSGRVQQFFLGGPLYCGDCYEQVPACSDCDWHIAPEDLADHLRQAHHD
jgi:hypothetical protein